MELPKIKLVEIASPPKDLLHLIQSPSQADFFAIVAFLFSAIGYLTHGRLWDRPDPYYKIYFERPQQANGSAGGKAQNNRNIAEKLEEGHHKVVVFWGSQSGTSERFAEQLARDCSLRFGLNALVADISDYDASTISQIPHTKFAIFLLSTYGEGDPSDNTAGLWTWIRKVKDESIQLPQLCYLAFGLGNSNYKYYNKVVDVVAEALDDAGASALLPIGRADDAHGATEEDFLAWKDEVFALFRTSLGLVESTVAYQPIVKLEYIEAPENANIHHGIPSSTRSATCSDVAPLTITSSHQLYTSGDRDCLHMELDLSDHSKILYKTGDHIGIWPSNPEEEVDILITALGLQDQKHKTLSMDGKDKIPSPTTLNALFRNYTEVCGPVSRKSILDLAQFAPSDAAKARVLELGENKDRFADFVSKTHITIGRFLRFTSPDQPWISLPLSFLIETMPLLQPRYYSISSSSVISPRRIAITALVSNKSIPGPSNQTIHGLTSNYLLSMSKVTSMSTEILARPTYDLAGPNNILNSTRILAHVRKSKFKLPITSSTPLIMVAAGTGFAPFRAFIMERAKLHSVGKDIGKMVLFFGCRNPNEDYIYREELEKLQVQVGKEKLEIVTAFSRMQGQPKKYVQDCVEEQGEKVLQMLDAGASLYICGKASMAREVDMRMEDVAVRTKGMSEEDTKAWSDGLKKRGKWRQDVWG